MDQPRPWTKINRDPERYRISGVKRPWPIFWRDLILTALVWILFGIGFYNAFLYVEDHWFNHLPNPTKQQLVDIKEFAQSIRFYTYFSLVALVFMLIRFIGNFQFWYAKQNEAVTLTQIPVEAQAKVFGVSPALVSLARESKMTYVRIDKNSGFVADLFATNDPQHKPQQ
jgi:hypothetical protein